MDTMTQLGGNWTNVGFGYFNADLGKYIDYEENILNPAQVLETRSFISYSGNNWQSKCVVFTSYAKR